MAGSNAVDISKRPTQKATSVTIKRNGNTFQADWKVPSAAMSESNAARWQWLVCFWKIMCNDDKFYILDEDWHGELSSSMSNTQTWGEYKGVSQMGRAWNGAALTRAAFWPLTSTRVNSVICNPMAFNWVGAGDGSRTTYRIYTPRRAAVAAVYDETSGEVTFTVTPGDSSDGCERYDTRWRVVATVSGRKGETVVKDWAAFTGASASWTYDVNSLGVTFSDGTVASLRVEAYSRGLAGDGPTSTATATVAYPRTPTIKSIAATKGSTGRVTVAVAPGGYTSEIRLQRVTDVASGTTPTGSASWADVAGAVDDQQCSALYDLTTDALSSDGAYTWYRLVATNCGWTQYSTPKRADALFTPAPSATNDSCAIVRTTVERDGSTALVEIGFDEDTANTGTEIQWTDFYSWWSTTEPESFSFTWKDSTSRFANWPKSTSVRIRDLEVGKTYMVRARRYLETDDTTTYSPWSATVKIMPTASPSSVTLHAPEFVRRGQPIELSWEYEGDQAQTGYAVRPASAPKTSWASGKGTSSFASVSAKRYGRADSVELYVDVATGGDATSSNHVTVGIADTPTCRLASLSACTANPYQLTVYSSDPDTDLLVSVYSLGVARSAPDGDRDQLYSDVVWTASLSPSWVASGGSYSATVEIPPDADLVDGCTYAVGARVRDRATGLTSSAVDVGLMPTFAVAWAHKAPKPSDDIAVTADAESRLVEIALATPDGAAESDVYDVWRKTGTGYDAVAIDVPLDATVTDRLAPFGTEPDLEYRICLRTSDGDESFDDYPYSMGVDVLRIDFGGSFVELPYNVSMAGSWTKSFESRVHMDGSVGGYWDQGVARSGSFSSAIARPDAAQIEGLRALAMWHGAVFVRTPDGRAFQANVDVALDTTYESQIVGASLSVTEVDLTDEYRVKSDDIV